MTKPHIELIIDELVLHGFSAHDRERIGVSVEAELQRLLAVADPDRLAGLGRISSLDAGSFQVTTAMPAERIGSEVARSIASVAGTTGERR